MDKRMERMLKEVRLIKGLDELKYAKIWTHIEGQNHSNCSINTVRIAMGTPDILKHKAELEDKLKTVKEDSYEYLLYRDGLSVTNLMIELDFTDADRANMLKLVDHKPLTPLTFEDDEWEDSIYSKSTQFNIRCGSIARDKDTMKPYMIDAIVIRETDEDGSVSCCTGWIYVIDEDRYVMPRAYVKHKDYFERIYIDVFRSGDKNMCTTAKLLKDAVGDKYELIYKAR